MSVNYFNPEDRYFIIDSKKLNEVTTNLYGYCLVSGEIITEYEDLQERLPDGTGAYVLIKCNDDTITLIQDSLGSYGLFLYDDDNYWVLSNNFQYLVDYLKPHYSLTLNKDYADAFLLESMCSHVYGETMLNQITWIDRSATITIDINKQTISETINVKPIKTIPVDSPEGLEQLDHWYEKWVSIITKLNTEYAGQLMTDLTGGMDSRMVMALFLNPSIDLSKVWIHTAVGKEEKFREDFAIASEIARAYGFVLNDNSQLHCEERNYSLHDLVSYTSYQSLGFHKQFKPVSVARNPIIINFGGYVGELIRGWGKDKTSSDVIQSIKKRGNKHANGIMTNCIDGAVSILRRSLDRINTLYTRETSVDLKTMGIQPFFLETRWRNHFGQPGKEISHILLSPLFDPLLLPIKEKGTKCDDPNLLAAIIFTRYGKDLSVFPIEGGRTINSETIKYAKSINRECQYKPAKEIVSEHKAHVAHYFDPLGGNEELWNKSSNQPRVRHEDFDEIFNRAFLSPTVKRLFLSVYSESLYEGIKNNVDPYSWHPFSNCHAVIAIAKAIYDTNKGDLYEKKYDTPDFVFACAEEVSHKEYSKYIQKQLRHSKQRNIKLAIKKGMEKLIVKKSGAILRRIRRASLGGEL